MHTQMKINTISSGCHQSIITLLLCFNKLNGRMNGRKRWKHGNVHLHGEKKMRWRKRSHPFLVCVCVVIFFFYSSPLLSHLFPPSSPSPLPPPSTPLSSFHSFFLLFLHPATFYHFSFSPHFLSVTRESISVLGLADTHTHTHIRTHLFTLKRK